MADHLSNIFGVPALHSDVPVVAKDDNTVDQDSDEVRNNLKNLLMTGQVALGEALELAKQSESPRAYEVLSTLIANMASINSQIMAVHNTKIEVKRKQQSIEIAGREGAPPGTVNNTQNNIAFVGTVAQMTEFLDQKAVNKANEEGITDAPVRD